MKKFLFQGDSITDADRSRNHASNFYLGNGYPTTVAGMLGTEHKGEYEFINKAVSGNRIVDLYARIKVDILNLKPDYMSVLIGVNDVWHELTIGNGVSAEKYEKIYSMLIEEVLEELPNIKIFILEPFLCHGTVTDQDWDIFMSEVKERAAAAKRISEKYNLVFVPLQDKFEEAQKAADFTCWTLEGVHPTAMGHGIIARALIEAIDNEA